MNQVGLVGRITKDPELRYYNEKRPYTVFTLAINRSYKNSSGNVDADFIQCSAWGRLAETVAKHCGKGSMIGINGRLNTRSFINQKNNVKMYTMDVVAEDVRFYQLKTPSIVDLSEFEHPEQSKAELANQASLNDEIQSSTSSKDSSNESIVAETVETLNISKTKAKLPIPS